MQTRGRLRRGLRGLTFIEVMVSVAIFFTGAVVMIAVLPEVLAKGNLRASRDSAYVLAASKIDDLQASSYSSIAPSASGNFSTLLSGMTDISTYTWSYTSTEEVPGALKRVQLLVSWNGGSDAYVFYKADMNND